MTRARGRGEVERGRGSRWRSELGYACDGRGVGLAVAAVAAEVTWKWCRELREREGRIGETASDIPASDVASFLARADSGVF